MVSDDFSTAVESGSDMSKYPVVAAVLRKIHNVGKNLLASLESVPKQLEDTPRHVRMSYEAVRRTNKFLPGILCHAQEDTVGVRDAPFSIGF